MLKDGKVQHEDQVLQTQLGAGTEACLQANKEEIPRGQTEKDGLSRSMQIM